MPLWYTKDRSHLVPTRVRKGVKKHMRNIPVVLSVISLLGIVAFAGISFPQLQGLQNTAAELTHLKAGSQEIKNHVQSLEQNMPEAMVLGPAISYVLRFDNGVTLIKLGDTSFEFALQEIKDVYKPDIIIAPIGGVYTMDGDGAAYMTTILDPEYIIPDHYATFPVLDQTPDKLINGVAAYKAQGKTKTQVHVATIGEEFTLKDVTFVWLGHASWYIKSPEGTGMLFDPLWIYSQLYPDKYKDLTNFSSVDFLFVTHAHPDHFNPDAVKVFVDEFDPIIIETSDFMGTVRKLVPAISRSLGVNIGSFITKERLALFGYNLDTDVSIALAGAVHGSSRGFPIPSWTE